MEKKPLNIVVKDAKEAAKRLNEVVENGGFNFDFGINNEYVTTVSKNSDGSTTESKETVYRLIGFVDTYMGEELFELNSIKDEIKTIKSEREEMNRTLNVMNKSAFAPISILLLGVAVFTLVFGILTLVNVLPLPEEQKFISIILVIVGALALAGSITLFILRRNKKAKLLANKDEILKQDDDLKNKEKDLDNKTPQWYKDALWSAEGNVFKNASQRFELKK